jgi:hypothetical protein
MFFGDTLKHDPWHDPIYKVHLPQTSVTLADFGFLFLLPKTFNLFGFELCTKFDIYVFIIHLTFDLYTWLYIK